MNTNKYNWILYLITATIIITVAVQVYWNYKNFQLNKQRVTNEIQLSLDNAIEEYYAELAKADFYTIIETDNHNHTDSKFSFGKTEIKISTNEHKNDPEKVDSILVSVQNQMTKSLKLKPKNIKYDSISRFTQFIDSCSGFSVMKPNSIKNVKALKGKKVYDSVGLIKKLKPIFIALNRDSLEYNKIDSLLQKQLNSKNIEISYWFDHEKNDSLFYTTWSSKKKPRSVKSGTLYMGKQLIAKNGKYFSVNSKSTYLKPKEQFKLSYKNPFREALKRSSFGILLSFLLAAAIVSCLFYLLKIIKHQKQLAEVKNDLISNITHEFKTPIATIGVALESIKNFKVIEDKKKTENYLDMSSEQLSKLNVMVEKLLETATLDSENLSLNKENINISNLLNTVVSKHQLQNEDKSISFIDTEESIISNIDIFHFENAINNLVDNAVKYGGDTISIKLNQTKNNIIISVTDNGNTLTKVNKERIFEKFYRIPKGNMHDVKGFGIGLYYTKKIIEKHGGTIQLNLKNKLTAFNITFQNE